jgi:glycosyltransferase involved in cell wall biosynthesis
MYQLIKKLTAKYNVSVLTFVHDEAEAASLRKLENFCYKVRAVPLRHDHLSPKAYLACGFSMALYFYEPSMRGNLLQMLSEDDYDIVHYEMSQMAQYIIPSKRSMNVLTIYELNFLREREASPWNGRLQKGLRWLSNLNEELQAVKRSDFVLTLSDYDRAALERFVGLSKIGSVGIGCEARPYDASPTPRELSIAFLGSLMHPPNVEAIKFFTDKILPLLREKVPSVMFHVVASGVSTEIDKLDKSGIHIWYVYGRKKDKLLQECRVFVAPLLSGSGIRVKVLEAWALGMPVVATRLACRGLLAVDGWNVLIADTPQLFAQRILNLYADDDLCIALGKNGRATIEKFYAWPIIVQKYERLYSLLLSRQQ